MVVDAACSRCIQDGIPAKELMVLDCTVDDMSAFGFGGRAMVEIRAYPGTPKAQLLRVELGRRMNLSKWEVLSVTHEP
jgi:hypothetical protein